MKLKIDITMDNGAFADDPSEEIARILTKLSADLQTHSDAISDAVRLDASELLSALYDVNGNCVGACEVEV